MKKTILLLTGLIILAIMTQGQTTNGSGLLTLKVKIITHIPVNMDRFTGTIEEVIEGNRLDMPDTIAFCLSPNPYYDFLSVGDVRIITFKNSGTINENNNYYCNYTISKRNEIWLITKIEKTN
jgi:rRNA pseudouridine-1189 N-methylase Emg1 (Nep1/Mra1 family)